MMITRPVSTAPHKARVSHGIRQLARDVHDTFPEMKLHGHLHDAARELDAGRTHSAQRHLNAAIFGLQPQQVRRHGVHDDGGHEQAKTLMQQTYRHLLNVKDIEDMSAGNEDLTQRRRDAAMTAAPDRETGNAQLSWEGVSNAIELATFAGKPPGSGKNFAKLKGALAKRGASNPGALAAYIGRKKYGRKGFAKLGRGSSHANQAGGIELVGPHGYTHNWVYHGSPDAAPEDRANELSHYLAHHTLHGEDKHAAHLEAARRHGYAAKMSSSPHVSDRHRKMAAFHAKVARQARTAVHAHASGYGGIELAGPKGYTHGWIHASVDALSKSGGGAYLPEHPGFGILPQGTMTSAQHRKAAAGHLRMARKAPAGSGKSKMHLRFARMHAVASKGIRGSGAAIARAPRTGLFSGGQRGVELAGPKGYVHGWRYVGGPGLPASPPGRPGGRASPGRFFLGGKQLSQDEYQRQMNHSARLQGLKAPFPAAGFPAPAAPAPVRRVPGWVTGEQAAPYHGRHIRGDTGNGVVEGVYNHRTGTVRDSHGSTHKVTAIDPTALNAGFKGDVASSRLPADIRQGIGGYDRAYRTGAVYRNTVKGMGGIKIGMSWQDTGRAVEMSARTAMLERTPAPYGKPGGPGLYGVKGNKHSDYFEQVVQALMRKRGMDKAQASRIAWGALRKWGRGGGHVHPEVSAAAGRALGEEAKAGAKASGHAIPSRGGIELAGTAAGAAQDPRNVLGQFGTGAGQGKGGAGKTRAQRKAALLAAAKQDRARAKLLAIRIAADRAALASASGKVSKGQKGAVTTAKAAKTGSGTPAAKGTAARAKGAPSPLSNASTGLSPQTVARAAAAAKTQAGKMSKGQLATAIKALRTQEKNLLAAAAKDAAQAARL